MSAGGSRGWSRGGAVTHQVVERGALLLPAHVFEETVVGHQQQRAGVLPVVVYLPLPPDHRLCRHRLAVSAAVRYSHFLYFTSNGPFF